MEGLRLDDVERALQTHDPLLVETIVALANQGDVIFSYEAPEFDESVYTLRHLRDAVTGWQMRYKAPAEAWEIRKEAWSRLAATDDPIAHPDRLKVYQVIEALHQAPGAFARDTLLEVIRQVPIKWGTWRALKSLYKEAETSGDVELFGVLAARIDREMATRMHDNEVSRRTLRYMSRRAWRWLRTLGETFPAAYVDAAVAVLREYPPSSYWPWPQLWVANHIVFHNAKHANGRPVYGRARFQLWRVPDDLVSDRAFGALWKEDSRPLFELLERARMERVRTFAIQGLKADFRVALREVDVATIVRLCAVQSETVHDFVVWLLENSPTFEQGAFRKLGLHDVVVGLLDSPGAAARKYAMKYVRTHARDLPIHELLRHANHNDANVRKLAIELLEQHDPRKDVGLDGWAQLLGSEHGHEHGGKMIHKHFGAGELTLAWFRSLFTRDDEDVTAYAAQLFRNVHDIHKVDPSYFVELLDDDLASHFAITALDQQEPFRLTPEQVRRLVLHPGSAGRAIAWVEEGRITAKQLGADFWRAVAFEPSWRENDWVTELTTDGPAWARPPSAPYRDVAAARELLGDVRNFTAAEVGFEWLMSLVRSSDAAARAWASAYLFEAFAPAEFAAQEGGAADAAGEADLGGRSYLFTGKLATMTRSEAQAKVAAAHGKNAGSVTKSLDVLVIGDEGSPLYGEGKKGSKQVKAESLIAGGASLSIISETAFLQLLSGGHRDYEEADTIRGYEVLWAMGCGPDAAADAPEAVFARDYMRRHHPVFGPEITGMTVDAARALPDAFLTFERVLPLLTDTRTPVRKFALALAYEEMARWRPSLDACRALCETPVRSARADVRALVAAALLADDTKETQRLRIPPDALDRDGAFAFCESLDRATRAIGMAVIKKYPQLAEPTALFNLSDSPDRRVRAFVIEAIWRLYRDRHATATWSPRLLTTEYPDTAKVRYERGEGLAARPEALPATGDAMREFLRRVLFGVPPARLPVGEELDTASPSLPSAGRAKLYLLEVMRDIALQERDFATLIEPLLTEFAQSLSDRERGACLVALARIEDRWEVEHV